MKLSLGCAYEMDKMQPSRRNTFSLVEVKFRMGKKNETRDNPKPREDKLSFWSNSGAQFRPFCLNRSVRWLASNYKGMRVWTDFLCKSLIIMSLLLKKRHLTNGYKVCPWPPHTTGPDEALKTGADQSQWSSFEREEKFAPTKADDHESRKK